MVSQKCEDKRKRIVEAARWVFARSGYHSASLDMIAEKAGVAKGTLYLYFPSKMELFLRVIEEEIRRAMQRVNDPVLQIERGIFSFVEFMEKNKEILCNDDV